VTVASATRNPSPNNPFHAWPSKETPPLHPSSLMTIDIYAISTARSHLDTAQQCITSDGNQDARGEQRRYQQTTVPPTHSSKGVR
jgi:hypothetical protein